MDTAGDIPAEGETVCEALARCEATLHAAVCELHADVGAFKLGVERRLEEAGCLTGPLTRAVAQLQVENRQLRAQLEALTRRVEALTGTAWDRNAIPDAKSSHGDSISKPDPPESLTQTSIHQTPQSTIHESAASPSTEVSAPGAASGLIQGPMEARFSSRATIAVFSKNSSVEKDEPIEVDPASASTVLENGHQTHSDKAEVSQEPKSSPGVPSLDHFSSMARSHVHLPITATTKTSEPTVSPGTKAPEPLVSPVKSQPPFPMESQLSCHPAPSNTLHHPASEPLSQPAPVVKTWVPGPVKMMGSSVAPDRTSSMPSKSVTYSPATPPSTDRGVDTSKSVEKRRELVRSQTLPRSIGAQPRRPGFERLDSDPSRPKPQDTKPKLKRSQSFGVSSASSIKQILLEWCRSKTIGYQNIDIQNFSSSWSDGMAFCALVHSFFPNEFDYSALTPADRKHNFEVAFSTAEEKASCDRLIEVEDMMVMGHKPDPMCVFTYVQSLYNHLRRFE